MKKTKILIIGKTGQLGHELIKIFKHHNILAPNINELDISKKNETEKYILLHKPKIIMNASAYLDLNKCEKNPYMAFLVNWLAIKDLSLLAKKINSLFVHFSTNYVFDGAKKMPYMEDDETRPLQIYGMSKLAGEDAVMRYYPENSIIIRTSVLFGGDGSPEKGNFILNRIKDSKKKHLVIDSKQNFSITYAVDLTTAVKKMIEANVDPGIYHIVNKGICTWFGLTKYVFNLIHSHCKLLPVKRGDTNGKVKRPINTPLDTKKIRSLGIKLPFWKQAVKRYLMEEVKACKEAQ